MRQDSVLGFFFLGFAVPVFAGRTAVPRIHVACMLPCSSDLGRLVSTTGHNLWAPNFFGPFDIISHAPPPANTTTKR